jgi:fructokinase
MQKILRGAIELGGTKAICLIGEDLDKQLELIEIPTRDPNTTLSEIVSFFESIGGIDALGIGSFGPLQLNRNSLNYGSILNTPKLSWSGTNLLEYFHSKLGCEVVIDTDVNAAAIAEARLGMGLGLSNFIYLTIGTGIGGSIFVNGKPIKGLSHPEIGHIQLTRQDSDFEFKSACAFHENCVEGLASGKAIFSRWSSRLSELASSHEAWETISGYISDLLFYLCLTVSPERIVIGGGVSCEHLLEHLREDLRKKAGNYIPEMNDDGFLQEFLCLPKLGNLAGPYGSFLLTDRQSHSHNRH